MSGTQPASVICPKCGVKLSRYERKRRLFWQWALFPNGRRYKCHGCGKTSFIANFDAYLKKKKPFHISLLKNKHATGKAAFRRLKHQTKRIPQSTITGHASSSVVHENSNRINELSKERSFFKSLSGYINSSSTSPTSPTYNNPIGHEIAPAQSPGGSKPTATVSTSHRQEIRALLNFPDHFVRYQNTTTVEEEIETAKAIHVELREVIDGLMLGLHKSRHIELGAVQESTHKLIESMIRNPDAIFLLSKLKGTDSIAYTHCVDAAILAVFFGRHMGLTQQELNTLALGTLLLDIGKTQLPKAVLAKQSKLSHKEIILLQKHVQFSLDILNEKQPGDDVISIIENHHERYDGHGYPHRKQKMEIPFLAKIASIIDAYSAMTHIRAYRNALPPSQAIEVLQQQRGRAFQAELIDEFIHCLGVYPIGSMVILNTGEAGIVISQNQLKRLQPKVLIFRDNEKDKIITPFTRDLEIESLGNDGKPVFIKAA